MPHINEEQKKKYRALIEEISFTTIHEKGDLEFLVFILIKQFMLTREHRYATLHDAVYATIHSAEEYKRLYLDKREDEAINKNGEA